MASRRPDPSFYPSPRLAAKAPPETLAYVAMFDPDRLRPDGLATVDLDPSSSTYARIIHTAETPNTGDELHHFGWNACSSCLHPGMRHCHMERRYLIVPGLRSSRIHIFDTGPDPRRPRLIRVIEPEELAERTGYSRPHSVHCGPDGVYVTALGDADGDAPGGVFLMDPETFDLCGRWEIERGTQRLAYDAWWHPGYDTLITSEWGTPGMIENGLQLDLLLGKKYGHVLHFWDLRKRRHLQSIDIGAEHQMLLELRPAHDPTRAYGFVNSVISVKDLSSAIWLWRRVGERWTISKVIEIPSEPASRDDLPPVLKDFKAVPPLVSDINLSLDDRFLYVACWGTGDLRQYDVSDPMEPKLMDVVRLGGIVSREKHPAAGGAPMTGGPQMIEISRDGRRVYFTNSLYGALDAQFYPHGIDGWMTKLDASPQGGLALDEKFFIPWPKPHRPHQIRLEGGDCSSDSYCFP